MSADAINRVLMAKETVQGNLLSISGARLSRDYLEQFFLSLSHLDINYQEALKFIARNTVSRQKDLDMVEHYLLNQIPSSHPLNKFKHDILGLVKPCEPKSMFGNKIN